MRHVRHIIISAWVFITCTRFLCAINSHKVAGTFPIHYLQPHLINQAKAHPNPALPEEHIAIISSTFFANPSENDLEKLT